MACEICRKPYVPTTDDDSNEKPHVCNICGKSFSLKIQLKRHVLSHEEDVPYICNTCEKHLEQSSYNLKLSKKGTFACEICNKYFSSKKALLKHASDHTDVDVTCDDCGQCFKTAGALKKHVAVHKARKSNLRNECQKETSEMEHHCDICGKKFAQLRLLEKHQLTHKNQSSVDEHQTNGISESSKDIKPAVSSLNITTDNNLNSDGKHVCSFCNKSFTRKTTFETHVAAHFADEEEAHESPVEDDSDVDKDFECTLKSGKNKLPDITAYKTVKNKPVAESPKQQCLPKLKIRQPFQCDKCDVQCASKKTYERHLQSHEEIVPEVKKNYTCKICNESFDLKENYKKHKASHDVKNEGSAKTYTCQLCNTKFEKKRHLRKHLKCHFNLDPNETSSVSSGDIEMTKKPKRIKNLPCSFCGKLFAGETCLKKHEARHQDGDCSSPSKRNKKPPKPLICEFCEEDYTGRKSAYVRHKHSHTPEVCGICDARFVDRAALREHCRIHVGTEEGRLFMECSQKALNAKNGVQQPEAKVEYIYLVLR